ncbi:MAG: DEAD/DEAH box helicase family protein, partial [Pseudonocardiaceae bacterium]
MLLAPFDSSLRDYNLEPKRPRFYQRIAVNRALRAIARGQRRILLTLATGTGKTMVASSSTSATGAAPAHPPSGAASWMRRPVA